MNNNAIVHFLPPYSPDYNPIENMFSKLKTQMKALETDLASSVVDSDTICCLLLYQQLNHKTVRSGLQDVDCTINV